MTMQRVGTASLLSLLMLPLPAVADSAARTGHPRLYFTAEDLPRLRKLRTQGVHARIFKNLIASADWCLTREPRTEWIAPRTPDPIYENLYDRFYGMMHDMAVMEHLAFAYAYSGDVRYRDGARRWTLACCRVWKREADGKVDASKAYAVTRLLKGLAVCYDILYHVLGEEERKELRETMVGVGREYYVYFQNPAIAGPGHNKHHGSVEAGSFGVLALALLGEVPEAKDWLELMVAKHTGYLLAQGLTASGTQEQSSNYWASTMHYRIFFMDALRRVTGRDLFKPNKQHMPGRIALAAVAGPKRPGHNEDNQSVLFGPSYGQLDYWSPVLVYLAREYRRPIYQHFALWDQSLGSIQKTRYVTKSDEQLMFTFGGYVYAWVDPTVPDEIEPGLPLSFEFADVNEAYVRASYEIGAIVAAVRQGALVVHAGGRPVLVSSSSIHGSPTLEPGQSLEDDGKTATVCFGDTGTAKDTEPALVLSRPGHLMIRWQAAADVQWSCHGKPGRNGNTLTWPGGTQLVVTKGEIRFVDAEGHRDRKVVGMGRLELEDPMPMRYPLVTARPAEGELGITVHTK